MKTVFKTLSIICAIGFIGQLLGGNFFPMGLMLALVFGYFGWRESKKVEFEKAPD